MTARTAILTRLRTGSGPSPDLPGPFTFTTEVADPLQMFVERAAAVGMTATPVSLEHLPGEIVRAVIGANASAVAIWDDPLLSAVRAAIAAYGIEVLPPATNSRPEPSAYRSGSPLLSTPSLTRRRWFWIAPSSDRGGPPYSPRCTWSSSPSTGSSRRSVTWCAGPRPCHRLSR